MSTNRKTTTKKGKKSPEEQHTRTHIQTPEGQPHFDLGFLDFRFEIPANTQDYDLLPEEKNHNVEHQESGQNDITQSPAEHMVSPANHMETVFSPPRQYSQYNEHLPMTPSRLPNINRVSQELSYIHDLDLSKISPEGNRTLSVAPAARPETEGAQSGNRVMRTPIGRQHTPMRRHAAQKTSNLPPQQGNLIGLIDDFCEKLKQIQTIYDETPQVPEYISFAAIMVDIGRNMQAPENTLKSRDLQQSINKYNELSNNLETIKLIIAYNIYVLFNATENKDSANEIYSLEVEYMLYNIRLDTSNKAEIDTFFGGDPIGPEKDVLVLGFIDKLNKKDQAVKPKLDEINSIIDNGDDADVLSELGQLQGPPPRGMGSRHSGNNVIQELESQIPRDADLFARTVQNLRTSHANAQNTIQQSQAMAVGLQQQILSPEQYNKDLATMQKIVQKQQEKGELEKEIHITQTLLKKKKSDPNEKAKLKTKLQELRTKLARVEEIVRKGKQFTGNKHAKYTKMLVPEGEPEGESEGAQPEQAQHASGPQSPAPAAKARPRGIKKFFSRRTQERKTSPQRPMLESGGEEVSGQETEPGKKPGFLRMFGKSKKKLQGGGKSIKSSKRHRQTKKKQTLGNRRN